MEHGDLGICSYRHPLLGLDHSGMTCPLCDLAKEKGVLLGIFLATCNKCNVPMIVVAEHQADFSPAQKDYIKVFVAGAYPGAEVRWEMKSIKGHAHCHVEGL